MNYINPINKSPVDWLLENGRIMAGGTYSDPMHEEILRKISNAENYCKNYDPDLGEFWERFVVVCVYVNPHWNAAGICSSLDEVKLTFDLEDPRDHLYFLVDRKKALAEIRPYQKRQVWI